MLNSASGALVKETKEENFALKIIFFYTLKILTIQTAR
jgi:hypothetical protein